MKENITAKNNIFLGEFRLDIIPFVPEPLVEVTFEMSVDGILNVSAVETTSGKTSSIIIAKANASCLLGGFMRAHDYGVLAMKNTEAENVHSH